MAVLSKMSVDDICTLLAAISDLPAGNCASYQMQIRRQNISGQVLSVCDLEKLRTELQMSFGDWQLFNTCVLYLRGIEANIMESHRARSSHTASFVGDMKSPQGSLNVSSPYPYPQIIVPQSQFVFCNDQTQNRGKNMFDVPVLVQQVSRESASHANRQNADRTTSDFSFGSGTDEMELAWRRDVQPDSLKGPQSTRPAPTTPSSARSKRSSGGREPTARQVPIWVDSSGRPLSKSSYDLRASTTTPRKTGGNTSSMSSGGKRSKSSRKRAKPSLPTVPPPLLHSASTASDQMVQMVPAYIPKGPDSSGFIPLWYPTLPCVGEVKQPTAHQPTHQENRENDDDFISGSSSVSVDGTYDFPSDYSSGDAGAHQQSYSRRQGPASCPHSHHNRRRRRKTSRSSKSSGRGQPARRSSSRRSSVGRCSQKSAEGCTCDYFLYEEGRSGGRSSNGNPWTPRSPHKISSPDLSEIEAMTSS